MVLFYGRGLYLSPMVNLYNRYFLFDINKIDGGQLRRVEGAGNIAPHERGVAISRFFIWQKKYQKHIYNKIYKIQEN